MSPVHRPFAPDPDRPAARRPHRPSAALRAACLAALALGTAGCVRGCPSGRPPIHPNPNMFSQPKVKPQAASAFFYDGSAMRPPVPGTVALEDPLDDDALLTGKDALGKFLPSSPVQADPATLERGRERYAIYCAPCHSSRGDGKGILFQRGNVPTTSLLSDKVRRLPDGQIFDVVTHGSGLMPSYGYPIPVRDRWAIVAYVRQMEARSPEAP